MICFLVRIFAHGKPAYIDIQPAFHCSVSVAIAGPNLKTRVAALGG
jgi:hypothetical protein